MFLMAEKMLVFLETTMLVAEYVALQEEKKRQGKDVNYEKDVFSYDSPCVRNARNGGGYHYRYR